MTYSERITETSSVEFPVAVVGVVKTCMGVITAIEVYCRSHEQYVSLPNVLTYGEDIVLYHKRGWNSDRCYTTYMEK